MHVGVIMHANHLSKYEGFLEGNFEKDTYKATIFLVR
jgi:hypothetical protein